METNWLDLDLEKSISDYEFTKYAVFSLNKVINSEDFEEMDASKIFQYLSREMRIVRFNDFLKRYIYEKAGFEEPFEDVTDMMYKEIIVTSFRENHVPFSFNPATAKETRVVNRWLNKETIKRRSIFLLGFGLRMTDADVSEFLIKAIQEDNFDLFNIEEAVCWYCLHHGLSFGKAITIMKKVREGNYKLPEKGGVSWKVISSNPRMYLLNEDQLFYWIHQLKLHNIDETRSKRRYAEFNRLYDQVREIIAKIYQKYASESRTLRVWTREDISPVDVEKSLCSGIPTNQMGNLQKMSKSILAGQFQNKRMDRQRISRLLSHKTEVSRFDLITLLFFIYAEEVEPDWPVERYLQYIDEINRILRSCSMLGIYPVNPYESFVLMCLVTDGPLDVYSEVLEKSFLMQ